MRLRQLGRSAIRIAVCLLVVGTVGVADDESTEPPAEKPDPAPSSSLSQSLQADSGVAVQTMCTNCNNADLSLAGLGNEHVSVTCDGMLVPSGLAQIYLFSVMPATMIDKVAVSKGAADVALAGGAVGGGIEIERRAPKDDSLTLNAAVDAGSYGWRGARADLSGKKDWFGGSLIGSWSESDRIDANDDGNPNLPKFDRYTVEGTAWFEFSDNTNLKIGAQRYEESQLEGPASYDFITSTPQRVIYDLENVELDRDQYDLRFDSRFGDDSTLFVTGSWSSRSLAIEQTEAGGNRYNPTYDISDDLGFASAEWSRPVGNQSNVRIGMSGRQQNFGVVDIFYNQITGQPRNASFDEEVTETGLWIEWQAALGNRVQLAGGARYVNFRYTDTERRTAWLAYALPEGDRVVPRLELVWKPSTPWRLRFSAGDGFRSPDPIYDKVCCGRRYRNNRGVATESSRSFGVEALWQPGPRYKVGGAVFVTDFDDLAITIASLSFQYRPTYQNVNIPKVRNTSLSLESSVEATSWLTLKATASWLDADNRTPQDAIPALIDNAGIPTFKQFHGSTVPYVFASQGVLSAAFRLHRRSLVVLTGQFNGKSKIQWFNQFNPDFTLGGSEVQDSFVTTEPFWIVNFAYNQSFKKGFALNVGVDNVTDYVQSDLGDPRFDYKWGPLRGRYYYAGLSYRFDRGR